MNLFGVMEVSGSGLHAERVRAEVVAANMANAETTRTPEGGPYRRQHVVFTETLSQPRFAGQILSQFEQTDSAVSGVQVSAVVSDSGTPLRRFDPGHPDADKDGYVSYPDINPVTEMVDLLGAGRAYDLNGSAVQSEKAMLSESIEILK